MAAKQLSKRDALRIEQLESRRANAMSGPLDDPSAAPVAEAKVKGSSTDIALKVMQKGLVNEIDEMSAELVEARKEIERFAKLKEELGDSPATIRHLPTDKVRPMRFHNRDEKSFDIENDRDFALLVEDVRAKKGNLNPGLVRPLPSPVDGFEYEVVFGNRRLEACRIAELPFKAAVQVVTDDEAALLQQTENMLRLDFSPMERGLQIASYLDERKVLDGTRVAHGEVQQLAVVLSMNPKYVQKLLLVGSIPADILEAIPDIRQIPFRPAYLLARACRDDPGSVRGRIAKLDKGLASRAVVNKLLGKERKPTAAPSSLLLSMPNDPDLRKAFDLAIQKLEKRFDVRIRMKASEL